VRDWQMAGALRRPSASPVYGYGNALETGQEGGTGHGGCRGQTVPIKEKENSDHNM